MHIDYSAWPETTGTDLNFRYDIKIIVNPKVISSEVKGVTISDVLSAVTGYIKFKKRDDAKREGSPPETAYLAYGKIENLPSQLFRDFKRKPNGDVEKGPPVKNEIDDTYEASEIKIPSDSIYFQSYWYNKSAVFDQVVNGLMYNNPDEIIIQSGQIVGLKGGFDFPKEATKFTFEVVKFALSGSFREELKNNGTFIDVVNSTTGKTQSVPKYVLEFTESGVLDRPDPAKPEVANSNPEVIQAASQSEVKQTIEYTFNVEKPDIFLLKGTQSDIEYIVIKDNTVLENLNQPTEEQDIFQDIDVLDEEYSEESFGAIEEEQVSLELWSTKTSALLGSSANDPNLKEDGAGSTNVDVGSNTSPGQGSTDNLRPTKKGYLHGPDFKKTLASDRDGLWPRVSEEYKLTGFIFGKPKITDQSFIKRIKAQEGGIGNDPRDNAVITYKDKTIVPISRPDYGGFAAKKAEIDKLCTTSGGKRLNNIHTSKGIIWLGFSATFGTSYDAQKRFLEMNEADWWKMMSEKFYLANKADKIKSKIAAYFWTYMCWGSGAGGGIARLNRTLNLLSGTKNFTSGSITSKHWDYMNSLYDAGKEDILISAMYDCSIQFLLNISQPGAKNYVYRHGWVNGVNQWITDFHETS